MASHSGRRASEVLRNSDSSRAKEPGLQVDGIRAPWPGASREAFGNVLDEVRRDVHGDRFRDFRVGLEGALLGVL